MSEVSVSIPEVSIFRYKYDNLFSVELYRFACIHQYDDRNTFKDEWDKWVLDNKEIIENEKERLIKKGCNGNIEEKMFKSVRYYYRKKINKKSVPCNRGKYIKKNDEFLDYIDLHVIENIRNDIKPSISFNEFYENKCNILEEEITRLKSLGLTDETIFLKIKKNYKNRYFQKTKI